MVSNNSAFNEADMKSTSLPVLNLQLRVTQPAITCSKLTARTLEQGAKCLKLTIKTPERRLVPVFLLLILSK